MGSKGDLYEKELKKKAIKHIKKLIKAHHANMKSTFIYKRQDEFFFNIIMYLFYDDTQQRYFISGGLYAKPYYLDDLFWDIFKISENKKQPDSLRANGAYVAPGFEFLRIRISIDSEDKLENTCEEFLNEFDKKIEDFLMLVFDTQSYKQYLTEVTEYHSNELLFILLEIQLGNFVEALKMIESEISDGNSGGFRTGNKDIYEFARAYCLKQLDSKLKEMD
jgi:hypothetical protein